MLNDPNPVRCDLCDAEVTADNCGQVTDAAVLCDDCLKRLLRQRERLAPKDDPDATPIETVVPIDDLARASAAAAEARGLTFGETTAGRHQPPFPAELGGEGG